MLLYKTKRYLKRKVFLKVPQRNTLVTIQEQTRLKDRELRILVDSMTKLLNGWEMAKKIQSNCKIYVKAFSGATVSCTEDYMKPFLRNLPDHLILHVGRNDLSENSTLNIAESITNLACRLKNEMHVVSVSTIILRTLDKKLNEKGMELNLHLKDPNKEKIIFLIVNSRTTKARHLNKSKLH